MAFPLRRNSGPDSEFLKMLKRKSSKKLTDETSIKQLDRNRKTNKSADFLCDNSSSSESLENIISTYKRGKKQASFDTSAQHFEEKQPMKPKRSSWFLRDRSREKFFKRASLDFTIASSTSFDTKSSRKGGKFQRQNATEADSSTDPSLEPPKKSLSSSGLSKFQLGKRLLKGEIGIRSFNYYLLKEGLKKRGSNGKNEVSTAPKSRSEENIYEEIYFRHDLPTPKPRAPPDLPPLNKPAPKAIVNCSNCEICLQEAAALDQNKTCDKCLENEHIMISSDGYARVNRNNSSDNLTDYFGRQQNQQQKQPMLTFQSYNPSYPNIYKLEMTPLVTPVEYGTIENKIVYPSFKSAAAAVTMSKSKNNEFYTRPNYLYPSNVTNTAGDKQETSSTFKASSSRTNGGTSNEHEIIYNGSQKSVQSNKSSGSAHFQMSDSSLGDSLFSSDPKKRSSGFGSTESCANRLGSLDHEKCSYSDATCNFKNCDCSSSYFSSDFDDKDIYNQTNMQPESYYEQQRVNLCHDDAPKQQQRQMKKLNHHYEVPKKQHKKKSSSPNHLTTASAVTASAQQKTSSSSTESSAKKKRITTKTPHEDAQLLDDDEIVSSSKSTSKQQSHQLKDDKISSKEIAVKCRKDNDDIKNLQSTANRRAEQPNNANDDNSAAKTISESEKDKKVIPVS